MRSCRFSEGGVDHKLTRLVQTILLRKRDVTAKETTAPSQRHHQMLADMHDGYRSSKGTIELPDIPQPHLVSGG